MGLNMNILVMRHTKTVLLILTIYTTRAVDEEQIKKNEEKRERGEGIRKEINPEIDENVVNSEAKRRTNHEIECFIEAIGKVLPLLGLFHVLLFLENQLALALRFHFFDCSARSNTR